jgi:alginate O-acetyltransferase complex protein AlgI
MMFNSIPFLIFLSLTILLYYATKTKYKWQLMVICSSVFLLFGGIGSLIIIFLEAFINYFAGIALDKYEGKKLRRLIFWSTLLLNIGVLGYFKYFNFLLENVISLFNLMDLEKNIAFEKIYLPLGISFYTFQAISYLIEVYRKSMKAEKNFGHFLNYLLFFPKLLAGPVERANIFLPQFQNPPKFEISNLNEGVQRIIWGLFKKIVIADRLAIYTSSIFQNYEHHNGTTLLIASLLYVFQLYADFSGYTDIALGVAKTMGIQLMENFKFPLYATSTTDFWRRWHISLSSWANDYIFTPFTLKYRHLGKLSIIIGLFLAFFVIGIWHGPNWSFVMFGLMQGTIVIYEMLTKRKREKVLKLFRKEIRILITILITLLTFTLSCVFFNFTSLSSALIVFEKIFTNHGNLTILNQSQFLYSLFGVGFLLVVEIFFINKNISSFLYFKSKWVLGVFWNVALVLLILIIGVFDGGQFIYFGF